MAFTLATAFVEIKVKYEQMRAGFRKFSDDLDSLKKKMADLNTVASRGFFGGAGFIAGTTLAASPDTMMTLGNSFKLLFAEIGLHFVPDIAKAAIWVQNAADWFRGLSEEQKNNFAKWVIIGTAISGFILLAPKFVAVATLMIGAFKGIGAAIKFAFAHPYITMATGFVAALANIAISAEMAYRRMAQFKELYDQVSKGAFVTEKEIAEHPAIKAAQAISDPQKRKEFLDEQQKKADEASDEAWRNLNKFRTSAGGQFRRFFGMTEKLEQFENAARAMEHRAAVLRAARGEGNVGGEASAKKQQRGLLLSLQQRPVEFRKIEDQWKRVAQAALGPDPLQKAVDQINLTAQQMLLQLSTNLPFLKDLGLVGP